MYRPEYIQALRLLSRAFDIAQHRGAPRPVIVGGSAVEFYTGGEIVSGDFDLVASREDLVAEGLIEVGFRREDRRGFRLGGFYHPEFLIGVEFVTGPLFDGRTDQGRLHLAIIDGEPDARVIFPPPEDVIADRLAQYASDPQRRDDMLEQARLLSLNVEKLDMAYLRKRVAEEGRRSRHGRASSGHRERVRPMRVVSMRDEAKRIEARKSALGLTDASFAAARNKGTARTNSKRQLLQAIAEEARRQRRTAPFAASF